MSSKPIVLVTGANGYIAGPVIEAFLKAGYAVRGTVRSRSSADPLVRALSAYEEDLEIVEVPDIVASGAFDSAVKGVHAIAHLAAGVSLSFTDPDPVLEVAIQGTLGVLESAITESSVKSVVLMSSVASIINGSKEAPARFTEADWNDEALAAVKKLGKESPSFLIYAASKVASEKAFWKFRDDRSPSFTMTALNPVFVMGPQPGLESISKIGGTTAFIWQILSGQEIPKPLTPNPGYVDVRDIARVAVFSVDHPDKANGERFLLASGLVPPQAAADVLRKAYPERQDIIKVGTPGQGYFPDYRFPEERVLDASKAVKVTGQSFYHVEQTITDTAKSLEKFL
ncbi:related to V.vinifera dihydroflavonol 4-reductase [Fusarium fujikuroi IMI 58289]|uniref:Related to V.vinifera dihydroflavonol 4-reductase n=1 Tax=Gibberella fujikuroi (strain CBS 195.34 / IMI 58289 / NRRL A-6831) TaxID=1279085 RepID=S0E592_GIBF5|nr:related to V.vinifera dihydroflavonol 4-reductase [Fusarium fujikuroi IMI 58289]CCT69936.1 related to V.vinifera dihydroflavonol 4-reductase [Fusarium fujikuroi IMI 58289]SCN85826.1 related to V.vinifera dihydroflavonol 4-reductase [Fusarium fujikuroi]SCO49588.1 related to V.vinifera dihydroflavonol 4-reductase [Fusarium fujikuroi]